MSYKYEKHPQTGQPEIVISGWEKGVAQSPHRGIANIQAGNIATETGEVMCSFNRVKQSQTGLTGTLTRTGGSGNTVVVSGINLLVGQVITIINGGTTGLSGNYYYLSTGKLWSGSFVPPDPDNASAVAGITDGVATFSITYPMTEPTQSCIETYTDNQGVAQARYYIITQNGKIWGHDSKLLDNWDTPNWFIINESSGRSSGLAVYNGWLVVFQTADMGLIRSTWLPTCSLTHGGATFAGGTFAPMNPGIHNSLVGHQGKLYVTDGHFICSFFADTSAIVNGPNIQSYFEYHPNGTTYSTILNLINGSLPTLGVGTTQRIPVVGISTDTRPTAIHSGTVYYLEPHISSNTFDFRIYSAVIGGSPLDLSSGALGRQFFNTFSPEASTLFAFSPQRVNLPYGEVAQCMVELGIYVIIGGKSNTLYLWDQVSAKPSDLIPLPENNVKKMITVNNVAYVFAGQKGNIYITNGSSTALAMSVPDYCAGLAGIPSSYIEPYFSWGDAMYMRGRVWFSILDQTATKAGNCGGVWSFVPTQNAFMEQDTGQALRLDNQSSYGTYNGYSPILIPNVHNQSVVAPQYWSAWISNINTPTYGIDYTDVIPQTQTLIETDLIPAGTMLNQKTFSQIEYKLSTPLVSGETITLSYRENSTDSYTSCGTAITESATSLSGYVPINFQKGQWIQLKIGLNPLASTASSFIRLTEIRIR